MEIKVRVTPEKRSTIQEHAQTIGESATSFINRAIDNQMERDSAGGPQEAAEQPVGARVVSLPSDILDTAQRAADAAGEAVEQFISRAVEAQVQRDKAARELGA